MDQKLSKIALKRHIKNNSGGDRGYSSLLKSVDGSGQANIGTNDSHLNKKSKIALRDMMKTSSNNLPPLLSPQSDLDRWNQFETDHQLGQVIEHAQTPIFSYKATNRDRFGPTELFGRYQNSGTATRNTPADASPKIEPQNLFSMESNKNKKETGYLGKIQSTRQSMDTSIFSNGKTSVPSSILKSVIGREHHQ